MSLLEDGLKAPRLRNAAATRASILEAARRRFARQGYEESGLRELARDAGVDAALICRYFGSKEELFVAALNACGEKGRSLTEVDRAEFGRITAHNLIYQPQDCEKFEGLLIMLRAATSPKAAEIVQRAIAQDFIAPFTVWIGGDDAEIRARLAAALIMGVALNRSLGGEFPGGETEKAALAARLADMLQSCID